MCLSLSLCVFAVLLFLLSQSHCHCSIHSGLLRNQPSGTLNSCIEYLETTFTFLFQAQQFHHHPSLLFREGRDTLDHRGVSQWQPPPRPHCNPKTTQHFLRLHFKPRISRTPGLQLLQLHTQVSNLCKKKPPRKGHPSKVFQLKC